MNPPTHAASNAAPTCAVRAVQGRAGETVRQRKDDAPTALKLLICDTDPRTSAAFRGCPVTVTTTRKPAAATRLLRTVDALLVDYRLSGAPALIAEARTQNVPALVVSSLDPEDYLPRAYADGADDWIAKPFGVSEIVARVRAIRRRLEAVEMVRPYPMHRWGGMVFEENARTLIIGATRVVLARREADVMLALIEARGATVPFDRLEVIFENTSSPRQMVNLYAFYLRARLRSDGLDGLIETVGTTGHRLRAVPETTATAS